MGHRILSSGSSPSRRKVNDCHDKNVGVVDSQEMPSSHYLVEREKEIQSVINPVSIRSDCDACPYCSDVCLDPSCSSCRQKVQDVGRLSPSEIKSCLPHPFSQKIEERPQEFIMITPCHLRRHNTKRSPWLLCGDAIYDATDFITIHPGGESSILKKSGGVVDCSRDMNFHSSRAKKIWKERRVGTLKQCRGCYETEHRQSVVQKEPREELCVIS